MTRTQNATAAPSEISDLVSGVCVRLCAAVFCVLIDLLTFEVVWYKVDSQTPFLLTQEYGKRGNFSERKIAGKTDTHGHR